MELETIHLSTLALTAIAILYADHRAYKYFRGTQLLLNPRVTKRLHSIVWCGLIGMIISGFFLFLPMAEYLLAEPAFYIKMAFVLVLVFNAWVIGKISHVSYERSFADLAPHEKHVLITSGALSLVSWISATLTGFLFL